MINNVNNATSFKASYVDKINIQKLNSRKKYVPYQANLVELNRSDLKALEEIRTKWKNSWLCGKFISWAEKMHSSSDKAFALTTQKENFENLQPNTVLGLMNIDLHRRKSELNYIITKPVNPDYNKVGSSLINYAKTLTDKITLTAASKNLVDKFYKPLGFIHEYKNNNDGNAYCELIWLKNATLLDKLKINLQSKVRLFLDSLINKIFDNSF